MAERYPLPKFHFKVDFGAATINFSEVSGLTVETKVIEYRDGDSKEFTKGKYPGMQEYGNVTFKRGVFEGDNQLFTKWYETLKFQTLERTDITVSMLNEDHEPLMTWSLKEAWAVKVQSTDLKADGNETAIDTLEVAHEGLTVEAV